MASSWRVCPLVVLLCAVGGSCGQMSPGGRALLAYNRQYGGSTAGYPSGNEYMTNRMLPYGSVGICLAGLMAIWGILFCVCRMCVCKWCPSFITVPAAVCFGAHDVPKGGFTAQDRKWPKIFLFCVLLVTIGVCAIGYVGNSKVEAEVHALSDNLASAVNHIVSQAAIITTNSASFGNSDSNIGSFSEQMKDLRGVSEKAKNNIKNMNLWRTDLINMSFIIAMGLVSIGVLGSLCNMSKLAMIMCILAWVALVISWLCFGLHMSISVFLDDTCYRTDTYLTSTERNMAGLDQFFKCPESTIFGDIHTKTAKSVNDIRSQVNDPGTGLPSLALATLPGETQSDIYKTPYSKLSAASSAFIARNNATTRQLQAISEGSDTPARKQRAASLLKSIDKMNKGSSTNLALAFFASCEFVRFFLKKVFDNMCGDLMTGFRYVYSAFALIGALMLATVIMGSKLSNRMDPDNWAENLGKSAEDEEKEQEGLLEDEDIETNPVDAVDVDATIEEAPTEADGNGVVESEEVGNDGQPDPAKPAAADAHGD